MKEKELSILICTIEEREAYLEKLMETLAYQIKENDLGDRVEILHFKDKKGQHKIGLKRNTLLQGCNGEYAAFIDDDDWVSDDYLIAILKALETKPDVVHLEGVYTVDGQNPRRFIHSCRYVDWFERGGIYFRPPNHLNPMKTSISKNFRFQEINHGEDRDWSLRISAAQVLRTEVEIPQPIYYYNYSSIK